MSGVFVIADMHPLDPRAVLRSLWEMTSSFYGNVFAGWWKSFFEGVYRVAFWIVLGIIVLDVIFFVIRQRRAGEERKLSRDLPQNLLGFFFLIVGYVTLIALIGFAFISIGLTLMIRSLFGANGSDLLSGDGDEDEENEEEPEESSE